jgi:hypothetical protein
MLNEEDLGPLQLNFEIELHNSVSQGYTRLPTIVPLNMTMHKYEL